MRRRKRLFTLWGRCFTEKVVEEVEEIEEKLFVGTPLDSRMKALLGLKASSKILVERGVCPDYLNELADLLRLVRS